MNLLWFAYLKIYEPEHKNTNKVGRNDVGLQRGCETKKKELTKKGIFEK